MKATRLPAALLRPAAALVAACALASCKATPPPPDVLLVTIDTLRADHCSAYGYGVATTPVLESLAARGVLFRRAYAESATTAPSHAVLMTGRHFRRLGVTANAASLPQDAVTIAERLREEGWQTAAFVSSFPMMARFGFSQGFDLYDDAFVTEEASIGRRKEGEDPHDRYAGATLAHAQKWLSRREDPRPLFLWVHFVDPHAPYHAPEKFDGAWPRQTSGTRKRYDEEVRYADKQLGLLLELFASRTPGREDFVVVTSDHGEGLGDHDWVSHGINLHEEAVRVPLVASWPGRLPAGRVVEEPVALVDVAPSVLGLLGLEAPTFDNGVPMFGDLDPARPIFLQRRHYKSGREGGRRIRGEMTAVVERGAKLIVAPDEDRRELYDLEADPRELDDLLSKRKQAAAAAQAAPSGGQAAAEGEQAAAAGAPAATAGRKEATQARAAALAQRLGRWHEDQPAAEVSEAPVDEETLKALRSLGYVD